MIHDKFLYHKLNNVPISIIQKAVAEATGIPIPEYNVPEKTKGSRKREKCTARQISMALAKKYNKKYSLGTIGRFHNGRDHATVLHACKTIANLLDINDLETVNSYNKAEKIIKKWYGSKAKFFDLDPRTKGRLVKIWIKHKVPLYIRQRILLEFHKQINEENKI